MRTEAQIAAAEFNRDISRLASVAMTKTDRDPSWIMVAIKLRDAGLLVRAKMHPADTPSAVTVGKCNPIENKEGGA